MGRKKNSLIIFIFILLISCANKINLTTPESVAKGFWKALKNKNKEEAIKYYITIEEVRLIGGPVDKFTRTIDRQISNIDDYIKYVEGYKWEKFEVINEEYSVGHKMIEGRLIFKGVYDGEEITRSIGPIGVINIRENAWKIVYIE